MSANKESYPDAEDLKKAISDLSSKAYFIDATSIALELNAPIAMNIVMAGALLGTGQIDLTREDIINELRESLPPDRLELNLTALDRGMKAIA